MSQLVLQPLAHRSRGWAFTLNNYTDEEQEEIRKIDCTYKIVGKEKGEMGTPHLQGYLWFKNARGFNSVKRSLPERAHIEPARGTPEQNKKYCSKQGDFYEDGECPIKGKRTDIESAAQLLKEGKPLLALEKDHLPTLIHYWSGFEKYRKAILRRKKGRRPYQRATFWIWGPARKGKTNKAMDIVHENLLPDEEYYEWAPATGFIDGYDGERIAVFDDFKAEHMAFEVWLQITDPWHNPCINVKGSSTAFIADICIFTSIQKPVDLWKAKIGSNKIVDDNQIIDRVHLIDILNPNPNEDTAPTEPEDEMATPSTRTTFEDEIFSNQL